ncbi:MAG: PEP-CTERM sorting domain-containing protein [Gammaproteobacteria bacterium]|nr:PEP-CTERM sorting domain-containing protein [Gammaproteobacteria bacterium]
MVFTIDNVLGAIDVPVNRIFFNDPNVFVTSSGEGVVTGVFADENILLVEQKVTHTYSTAGTFSVGVVRGAYYQDEVLNTEPASPSDLQMTQTIVLDGSGNDSAVIDNFSPIVDLAVGGNQAFQLSATDPDGDDVTWSFAPLFESGVNSLAAIGGNTIELNSSGLLSWDTTGGTVGSLYAVEAIAADSHGNRTSADFIVRLCDASTAGCNASSVPEPAPLALLGFGLVGLIISRRRPWLRRN